MNTQFSHRTVLALAATALVAACGGTDTPQASAQDFQQRLQSASARTDTKHPLAAASLTVPAQSATLPAAISNDQLFTWAQKTFPQYFGTTAPQRFEIFYDGKTFDVAGYTTANYIGVANGRAYILGTMTGGALVALDLVSSYIGMVCSSIDCGSPPLPVGSLNECIDANAANLPTGFRTHLVFAYSGVLGGEQTIDTVIDGPATFEGKSATQTTSTVTGSNSTTVAGVTTTTTNTVTSRTYLQPSTNGLYKTLGNLTDITNSTSFTSSIPGVPALPGNSSTTQTKLVFNPATENVEYTLKLGETLEKTTTQTVTTLSGPFIPPPTTTTTTQRYTFEAKESVSVLAGTFNTCRYKISETNGSGSSTLWLIVGKGIPVKTVATAAGNSQTVELKSGTYNGGPL